MAKCWKVEVATKQNIKDNNNYLIDFLGTVFTQILIGS